MKFQHKFNTFSPAKTAADAAVSASADAIGKDCFRCSLKQPQKSDIIELDESDGSDMENLGETNQHTPELKCEFKDDHGRKDIATAKTSISGASTGSVKAKPA